MLTKVFKDSFFYTLPAIFQKGLSFFLLPLYTRLLSPADYGALDLLIVFSSLIHVSASFEITQAVARFYPDDESEKYKSKRVSSAFIFILCCYLLFALIAVVFSKNLAFMVIGQEGKQDVFMWAILYIVTHGVFLPVHNQFRWELRSKEYSFVSLIVSVSMLAAILFFTLSSGLGLAGILMGMTFGTAVGFVVAMLKLSNRFSIAFDKKIIFTMLKYSIPLVPASISVLVSLYIDRLMINHFLSLGDVGLYGVAFRVVSIVKLALVGFGASLSPIIYANYKEKSTPIHIEKLFRIFLFCSGLLVLFLGSFSKLILTFLTTPDYYSAASVVVFLVPSVLLSSMYIFAPGIDIAKKTYLILWINLAGALINTVLNWYMIPRYGLVGAALATLSGYVVVFVSYMVFSQKLYPVPHRWKPIVLCVALTGIAVYLIQFFEHSLPYAYLWKTMIVFIIMPFIYLRLKLVKYLEIKNFMAKMIP